MRIYRGVSFIKKKSVCNRGFALTEILLSLLLISIMILPLTSLFVNSFNTYSFAGEKTKAVYLAQGMLEETLKEDYNYLSVDQGFNPHPQFPMYEYRINIIPYSGNSLYEIIVELREINKPGKMVTLTTLGSRGRTNGL